MEEEKILPNHFESDLIQLCRNFKQLGISDVHMDYKSFFKENIQKYLSENFKIDGEVKYENGTAGTSYYGVMIFGIRFTFG